MNSRLTAIFAALLAIVTAVYFLSGPPAKPLGPEENRVVSGMVADQVVKIEVARKDAPTLEVERARDAVGEYWQMVQPTRHPAEANLVQQMLYGLDRFVKSGALEPGKPETAPEITGLADPRLSVTWHSRDAREVLRFGKAPSSNTTVVFYQREGDPKIYLVGVETFDAFDKPIRQYRAKALVRYAPHQVMGVELERRFFVKRAKDRPGLYEYEKSVLEKVEQGGDRGWHLVEPHREKLDDIRVQGLITELSNLETVEVQEAGDPKVHGFDEPEVRIALKLRGVEKPVAIHFGRDADSGRKRWVRVPGSGEEARIEMKKYDELSLQRKELRTDVIFPFSRENVKTFGVDGRDLGKIVIERRETKKEEPVPMVTWELLEPKGLRVDPGRVEAFVANVMAHRITDFWGAQDFKLAGLDPGEIQVAVTTKDGKNHRFHFSAHVEGVLRKEGVEEIFVVPPKLVADLRRLELNFLHPEMFNVPRDRLREFTFESRVSDTLQPVAYRMKLEEKTGKWRFVDPAHEKEAPDEGRLNAILAVMNYIKAESLIGRDPKTLVKYRLDGLQVPSTLRIVHAGDPGGTAEILISVDLSDKPTKPMYYARLKDSSTVFQINALFVESLKRVPVRRKPE